MPDPNALLLALETSCDETACAILEWRAEGGVRVLAAEVASQAALHEATGGVVPEVASRQHLRDLRPLLDLTLRAAGVRLEQVAAFAATIGPGLAGALMIGVAAAKGLAIGFGRPFVGVNHLEGHLLSPFFDEGDELRPATGLVVSGGHTLLIDVAGFRQYQRLGGTLDDAAGEAFDKVAKLLGLPYPGGPVVDRLARTGRDDAFAFPRSLLHEAHHDFSFSGLKTAVRYLLPKIDAADECVVADVCASFQQAVVEVLVEKTVRAARASGRRRLAISGGVSLNSGLRAAFAARCAATGLELCLTPPSLCTDNAAMIGHVGLRLQRHGLSTPLTEDIDPNLRLAYAA
ncbi:MAG: tRNA (adenosine(37)-N6)-threonylcarbamoyltransferase complex transferase subunit TsaD [Verrucomicrobia bacterium]|nr:tRNA (adenosine(37)-N6)-threonylcarbamoyltransferase complex transferase subunit TsaD [Verrucomicrobiota bacterium]